MFHSYQNENKLEFPELEEICSQSEEITCCPYSQTVILWGFFSNFNFVSHSLMVQRIDNALMWIFVAPASFISTKKIPTALSGKKKNT